MSIIAGKLDRKLPRLFEAIDNNETTGAPADWKNPASADYDRQYAEDALYHTVGPLTDRPTWAVRKDDEGRPLDIPTREHWTSPSEPPAGWRPGGPAPKWTQQEVVTAMAGDPSIPSTATDDPRSPAYGNKGGSPLYRWAKQIARHYSRPNDMAFREDLYGNGLIQLMTMMQPGYDESRSPFISFVSRDIFSAMQHGVGAPKSVKRVLSKKVIHRPSLPDLYGIGTLMKMDDPDTIRMAASAVKGKYREERSYDKSPDNPFGPFSSEYYRLAMAYADALESGDEYEVREVKYAVKKFVEDVNDAIYQTRGASTGLGQAISTPNRKESIGIQSMDAPAGEGEENAATSAGQIMGDTNWESFADPETIHYIFSIALTNDLGKILAKSDKYKQFAQDVFYMDVDRKHAEAMKAYEQNQEAIRRFPEAAQYRLADIEAQKKEIEKRNEEIEAAKAEKQELIRAGKSREAKNVKIPAAIVPLKPLVAPKALPMPKDKPNRVAGKAKIGGPMTVNELRHMARLLGPIGSNYPGRGNPRQNTKIPRDAKGWCIQDKHTQEDPEIEPIPSGGTWNSIWKRNGYPSMASSPSAMADEFTKEVLEFNKLGIPSARAEKVAKDGVAMGKVAVNTVCESAKLKFMVVLDIHRADLGLDESIQRQIPLLESVQRMTPLDRHIVVETCEWIIAKINAFQSLLAEDNGHARTVNRVESHTEQFVDEGMQPVDALDDSIYRTTLLESRQTQPAIIRMRRGTVIPVDHVRKIRTPAGREIYVVGIGPGAFKQVSKHNIGPILSKMRDFCGPVTWHPSRRLVRYGDQDHTGWSEPDEDGNYRADRDAHWVKKFKTILTMNPENIQDIRLLPPGTDPNQEAGL